MPGLDLSKFNLLLKQVYSTASFTPHQLYLNSSDYNAFSRWMTPRLDANDVLKGMLNG